MNSYFLSSLKNAIKHWYIPLIVGILFIITSFVVFSTPLSSLLTLAIIMSVSFIVSGIFEVVFALSNRRSMENWGWSLVFGLLTLIVGFMLVTNPALSILTLSLYVGFILLSRSIGSISFAIDIKRHGIGSWVGLLIFGILGTIVSIILLMRPIYAGISAVYLIGFSFLFGGIFSIFWSIQLRKIHRKAKKIKPEIRKRMLAFEEEIRSEWEREDW